MLPMAEKFKAVLRYLYLFGEPLLKSCQVALRLQEPANLGGKLGVLVTLNKNISIKYKCCKIGMRQTAELNRLEHGAAAVAVAADVDAGLSHLGKQ